MNGRSFLLLLSVALCSSACAHEAGDTRPPIQYVPVSGAAAPLPFSEAVKVGDMLYLSGQIGLVPGTTTPARGGIGPETRQTLENIKAVLERNGSSLDNVVKCTVMLADMSEWEAMNSVYVTYFVSHKPARSALGASGLARGARVEIECMAVMGGGTTRPAGPSR